MVRFVCALALLVIVSALTAAAYLSGVALWLILGLMGFQ